MKGNLQRIRDIYGVPAKRFGRVRLKIDWFGANEGVIVGAGHRTIRVRVQSGGVQKIVNFAPGDLEYLPDAPK